MLRNKFVTFCSYTLRARSGAKYAISSAHFIADSWQLTSITLDCSPVIPHSTSFNSLQQRCLMYYDIQTRFVYGMVNESLDCDKTDMDEQPWTCLDALCENCVNIFLKTERVQSCLVMARSFMAYLIAAGVVTDIQTHENGTTDIPMTTWWMTFQYCSNLLKLRPTLSEYGHGAARGVIFPDPQWEILEDVVAVVKPFMVVHRFFDQTAYVTSSFTPFFLGKINEDLLALASSPSTVVRECLVEIRSKLNSLWGARDDRFASVPFNDQASPASNGVPMKILMSAALDPRVKLLGVADGAESDVIWDAIEKNLIDIHAQVHNSSNTLSSESETKDSPMEGLGDSVERMPLSVTLLEMKSVDEDIFAPFNQARKQSEFELDTSINLFACDQAKHEVHSYRKMEKMELRIHNADGLLVFNNPFAWWRQHSSVLPLLSRLAMRVLAIPATAKSTNRLYTQSGGREMFDLARTLDHSQGAEIIVCLRENWEELERQIVSEPLQRKRKVEETVVPVATGVISVMGI